MRIEEKHHLNEQLLAKIKKLEAIVHERDLTHRDIYLESRFNFDQSMPAFFLAWQEDQLIGFLSIYADNLEEAEISVIVHPDYRREGVATALIESAKKVIRTFGILSINYISERRFIEDTGYLEKSYYVDWEETEYIMEAREVESKNFVENRISVREAVMEDAREIASFQAEAFDSTFQEAMTYAEGSIGESDHAIYLFTDEEGRIVGSSSVNITDDYYYLFGLAIDPKHQDQGVGTVGVYKMMKLLNDLSQRPFRLSVEKENQHARHLYQKNGFKNISEVIYLSK